MSTITCSIDGCGREVTAKHLCPAHYKRLKTGRPMSTPVKTTRPAGRRACNVEDCDRISRTLGLCALHYQRHRHGRSMDGAPQRRRAGRTCRVTDCGRPHEAKGLCNGHLRRQAKGIPLDRPWRGYGQYRTINDQGYAVLRGRGAGLAVGEEMLEHRYVMEQLIGRALQGDESVHHKNGVRDDNRLSNLELWASTHPSGQRVTDLLGWAKEIIQRYEGLPLT